MSQGETLPLPTLYADWIGGLLEVGIPSEPLATCDDCAMCAKPGEPRGPAAFNPAIKCCTYLPTLPNFRVGQVLNDRSPAAESGRSTIIERIRRGMDVTPLGLGRPKPYDLLYKHAAPAFGRARALRCPHYIDEGGRCGIWRYRNAVCATYFCKYERGAVGRRFWGVLRDLLHTIERTLSNWCVAELALSDGMIARLLGPDPGDKKRGQLTAADLDGEAEQEDYASLWGEWQGREEELFADCARRVEPLGWADILAIGGPELRLQARLVKQAHGALLDRSLPPAVEVGRYTVISSQGDRCQLYAYSGMHPLEASRRLLEILPAFGGRPIPEALAAIEQSHGLRLPESLVRKLVDHEILVPPNPASLG